MRRMFAMPWLSYAPIVCRGQPEEYLLLVHMSWGRSRRRFPLTSRVAHFSLLSVFDRRARCRNRLPQEPSRLASCGSSTKAAAVGMAVL